MTRINHALVPISKLKATPMKVFEQASNEGPLYVLNRSRPVAVVMSLQDYQNYQQWKSEVNQHGSSNDES